MEKKFRKDSENKLFSKDIIINIRIDKNHVRIWLKMKTKKGRCQYMDIKYKYV